MDLIDLDNKKKNKQSGPDHGLVKPKNIIIIIIHQSQQKRLWRSSDKEEDECIANNCHT